MTPESEPLTLDHPDLTTYALDALADPERRATVARAVDADPALQAEVAAIREAAGLTGQALREGLRETHRDQDVAASLMEAALAEEASEKTVPFRFPAWLRSPVTGLAAMGLFGLGLFFLMQEPLDLGPEETLARPVSLETAPASMTGTEAAPEPEVSANRAVAGSAEPARAKALAAPQDAAAKRFNAEDRQAVADPAAPPAPVMNLAVDPAALADADAALPKVHLNELATPTREDVSVGSSAAQDAARDRALYQVPSEKLAGAQQAGRAGRPSAARLLGQLTPSAIEADLEAIRLSELDVDATPEAAAAQVNLQLLHAQQTQQARGLADAWTLEIVEPTDGHPARTAQPERVQLRLTGTSGRAAIEALAEQLDADVAIQPGKVQLIRRSGEE